MIVLWEAVPWIASYSRLLHDRSSLQDNSTLYIDDTHRELCVDISTSSKPCAETTVMK